MDSYQSRGREVTAYDLLIITPSDYIDDYSTYCEYYNSIGLRNRIVAVTEVYASMTGNDNQDKIRNYIFPSRRDDQ